MVFREGPIDGVSANLFSTHIGIANDAIERIEALAQRIATIDAAANQATMDSLAHSWSKGWQDVWDQLGEARAIVVRFGRDVSKFDEARAAAGDIYLDAASGRAVRDGRYTHITWKNKSTGYARLAIAALSAVMPEVVVVNTVPTPQPRPYVEPTLYAPPEPRESPANVYLWLGIVAITIAFTIYAVTR